MMTNEVESRALAMVGVPFRLQGRGEGGVDCVGLVLMALGLPGDAVRRDYRMRGHQLAEFRQRVQPYCRRVARTRARAGDLLLIETSADQIHVAILTARGHVHAHAGLRKVVETPGLPEGRIAAVYRKRLRPKRNG